MTCQQCRDACSHPTKKERAARAHAATSQDCGCESFSVSDYSPSVVGDGEELHFVISDPKALLNGSLNPTSLIQIDSGGLSILRNAASDDEFLLTINQLRSRAVEQGVDWYFFGVCTFSAQTVRYEGSDRFLCVYDTGLSDKPHHADIMGPDLRAASGSTISKGEHERRNRARIKRMIDKIGPVFNGASRFRGGIFSEYARPNQ